MPASPIKVFKFGGASVCDTPSIRNVAAILKNFSKEKLVIVVSAMGKMTQALEEVHKARFYKKETAEKIERIRCFHQQMIDELFTDAKNAALNRFYSFFNELENIVFSACSDEYDREYDRIIGYGELLSSSLIHAFLAQEGIAAAFADARRVIYTDNRYRDARVDWEKSRLAMPEIKELLDNHHRVIIQGFIGCGPAGELTSLGREGSDFTAAIMAFLLDAESVIIWKDVPGMLNADPKWFPNTVKLNKISFYEAIELAYYGAGIIHPRTIKPLQNKGIPLYIRSFMKPEAEGTAIQENTDFDHLVPCYISKKNQCLVSFTPKDFSFVVEDNLQEIFDVLVQTGIRIHLMENAALSFSICIDHEDYKMKQLFEKLGQRYHIRYNSELTLMTVRHYDDTAIEKVTKNRTILLEQRSRQTIRMIMR